MNILKPQNLMVEMCILTSEERRLIYFERLEESWYNWSGSKTVTPPKTHLVEDIVVHMLVYRREFCCKMKCFLLLYHIKLSRQASIR